MAQAILIVNFIAVGEQPGLYKSPLVPPGFVRRRTMLTFQKLLFVAQLIPIALASEEIIGPKITLDKGVFTGKFVGLTHRFLGIPFAKPPVDDLRFRLPQTIPPYVGKYDASKFGPACPQQAMSFSTAPNLTKPGLDFIANSIYGKPFPDSEDCLTINVVKPALAGKNSKLPVVVWIFGGGFEIGSPEIYDGGVIVTRSIAMRSPVLFVSMNYRLTGFGFLAGKEVKEARVGNLGLHDQREALRWVQKYISEFGGDPSQVTIFGESAGAISVSLHMLAFGGKTDGLFRAGLMMSGAPIPVGDITNGQKYYDAIVEDTGCFGSEDTLGCLRTVSYQDLKAAIDKSPSILSYQSLNLAWLPRTDGVFLTDDPQRLVQQNKIANIPYVTGNCDDEGTLFSFSTLNVTTDAQLREWIQTQFLPGIPDADLDNIMKLYPADVSQGSPFDTGRLNALTRQFKRIAAFQGDGVFQAPRRWMLDNTVHSNPNVWVYLSKRFKLLPILGSAHGSDLLNMFGVGELGAYLVRFATNLDPNPTSILGFEWPKYDLQSRKLLTFYDLKPVGITQDNYRKEAMKYLTQVTLANPI